MDTQGPSLSTVARGTSGGRCNRSPEVSLGVLPSLPSLRLPVPPVITGSPSPRAHAQAHTHLRPFQQAVLPPGGKSGPVPQVPVRAFQVHCSECQGSGHKGSSHWGSGHRTSPHLVSLSKSISSTKQQRCGINVPVFCNPFLWGLTNPGRGSETCGLAQVPASWWQTRPYPPGSHFPPSPMASPLWPLGG